MPSGCPIHFDAGGATAYADGGGTGAAGGKGGDGGGATGAAFEADGKLVLEIVVCADAVAGMATHNKTLNPRRIFCNGMTAPA